MPNATISTRTVSSRIRRLTATALGAALVLAACGGSGDTGSDDTVDRQRNAALVGNTTTDWKISHIHAFHQSVMVVLDDGLIRFSGNVREGLADELNGQIAGSTIAKVRTGQNLAGVLDTEGRLTIRGYDWQRTNPQLPVGATKWVDFDLNLDGVIAIADNGSVVMASRGTTYKIPSLTNGGTKFVRVVAGWFHYGLLDDAGNAYLFGFGSEGATTLPAFKNGGTKFVDIDAEFYSTGLLDDAGNAYLFGWIQSGFEIPALRGNASKFVDIEVGQTVSALVDDLGQLYHVGSMFTSPLPTEDITVVSMVAGSGYTIAISDIGRVLIESSHPSVTLRQRVPLVPVAASGDTTLVVGDDGVVQQIGEGFGDLPRSLGQRVAVAAGTGHGLALTTDGTITAWGQNGFGQATPPSGSHFTKIAGASAFSVGLNATGGITTWGTLVIDNYTQNSLNAAIGRTVDIVAGVDHATALLTNGTVQSFGSLARLAPNRRNTMGPEAIASFPSEEVRQAYIAVASNGRCAAALSMNQTVVSWGTCDQRIKKTLGGDQVALALGAAHALALGRDGTVTAWGDNTFGQTTVPAGLTDVVYIAAGDNHSVAVDAEGRVWAWGDNSQGQTTIPDSLRLSTAELRAARAAAVVATAPAPAPVEIPAEATKHLEEVTAQAEASAPAPVTPANPSSAATGLTVKKARTITPAQGLKLLQIKGGKKPVFVVTKRLASSPCTVTKARLTAKKSGVCSATIAYTNAQGKKAKARLVVVITS